MSSDGPGGPGRLDGRVVLVTGAASGIGRATARRAGAEGAHVGAIDVDRPGLDTLVAELPRPGAGPRPARPTSPTRRR